MLITDFYTCMHVLLGIEVSTILWDWVDELGTGKVYNREKFEGDCGNLMRHMQRWNQSGVRRTKGNFPINLFHSHCTVQNVI